MSENAIIYDDYFYNLKAVKTHIIAKNINKSLLNDKGLSIGKFTQKVKCSYWKLINDKGKRVASLTKEEKILRE
ncbi:TPA: hypothetical protein ACYY9V_002298 [Staphylococcus aureus]